MDTELQIALRNLQRAGGSFSQLKLHTFLSDEELQELHRHVILARMRLLGIELVVEVSETFPVVDRFPRLVIGGIQDDGTRLFREAIHLSPWKTENPPNNLEEVGPEVIDYFAHNWKTISNYKLRQLRLPMRAYNFSTNIPADTRDITLKRSGLQLIFHRNPAVKNYLVYLAIIWKTVDPNLGGLFKDI